MSFFIAGVIAALSLFEIGIVGALIVILSVLPGIYFWWPSRRDPMCRSDLGVALMTGALIAFAVLTIQVLVERNIRERDLARQKVEAHENFRLTLSLEKNFTGIRLEGERRNMRGFYLYDKIFRDAVLTGADFTDAILTKTDLVNARLEDANLERAVMTGTDLTSAKMPGANLHLAILFHAILNNAILAGASLVDSSFESAEMANVDLRGAHLEGASLGGTVLKGTDMTDATVDEETSFSGAIYDRNTRFPAEVQQEDCRQPTCYVD